MAAMLDNNSNTLLYIGDKQIIKMYKGEELIYVYNDGKILNEVNISSMNAMKNLVFVDTPISTSNT